jgi:signal transduction histidine kinase
VNPYVRALFSAATLATIALYGWTLQPALPLWGLLAAMCLLYQAMIWTGESWWTRPRYAVFVSLALALALAVSLFDGGQVYASVLLIPPVLLLAREQGEYRRLATGLAVATMLAILVLSRLSPFAFTLLPGVLTLYVCVRAINIYKGAHRLGQRHLEALDTAHRELQQAHAELQEASVHSMRYAALVERTRLAREMHDGLGHQLTSLIVQLQALEIMLPNDPERAAGEIRAMLDVARAAMAEVRLAVGEWREDESGLGLAALQGLVSQTAANSRIAFDFQQQGCIADWPVELSVALYRIVQEALTNIMRHAAATSATVRLEERDGQVILTVADDGHYTVDTRLSPGYGFRGIMERSHAFGGSFALSQNQPHGLILQIALPVNSTVESGMASGSATAANGRVASAISA